MKSQYLTLLLFSIFCVLSNVYSEPSATPGVATKAEEVPKAAAPVGVDEALNAFRAMMVPDKGEMSTLHISHYRSLYVLGPFLSGVFMVTGFFMAMCGSPTHFFADLSFVITLVGTLYYGHSRTFKIPGLPGVNLALFSTFTIGFFITNHYIHDAIKTKKAKKTVAGKQSGSALSSVAVSSPEKVGLFNGLFTPMRLAQLSFMFINVLAVTYYFTTPTLFFSLQLHRMFLERLTPLTNWGVVISTIGLYSDYLFPTAVAVETVVAVSYWALYFAGILSYPASGKQEMKSLALIKAPVSICLFDILLHATPLLFLGIMHVLKKEPTASAVKLAKEDEPLSAGKGFAIVLGVYTIMYACTYRLAGYKGPYKFMEVPLNLLGKPKLTDVSLFNDRDGVGLFMNGLTDMMLYLYKPFFAICAKEQLVEESKKYVIHHAQELIALNTTYSQMRNAAYASSTNTPASKV